MSGLSDDARRLLRAGQTVFLPNPRELEATRAALKAKLSAEGDVSSGPSPEAAGKSGLRARWTQVTSGALLKIVVAGVVATGGGLGYVAFRARPTGSASQPPVAAAPNPEPAAAAPSIEQSDLFAPPAAASEPPASASKWVVQSRRPNRGRPPAHPAARVKPSQPQRMAAPPETPALASSDGLAQEVEVIRRAGAQLRLGQAEQAIRELDGYVAKFPNGRMQEEQLALRALALCKLGRVQQAQNLVNHIRAVAPGSPHLKRIWGACRVTP